MALVAMYVYIRNKRKKEMYKGEVSYVMLPCLCI